LYGNYAAGAANNKILSSSYDSAIEACSLWRVQWIISARHLSALLLDLASGKGLDGPCDFALCELVARLALALFNDGDGAGNHV
jgi:hypothetical protein